MFSVVIVLGFGISDLGCFDRALGAGFARRCGFAAKPC